MLETDLFKIASAHPRFRTTHIVWNLGWTWKIATSENVDENVSVRVKARWLRCQGVIVRLPRQAVFIAAQLSLTKIRYLTGISRGYQYNCFRWLRGSRCCPLNLFGEFRQHRQFNGDTFSLSWWGSCISFCQALQLLHTSFVACETHSVLLKTSNIWCIPLWKLPIT